MRSISGLSLAILLVFQSCGNKEKAEDDVQENKAFYPIAAYVHTELAQIDSLPLAVFLYTEEGGKLDTTIVDKKNFRTLAEEIPLPDITLEPLKQSFKESVYMDATLNLITMSYSPKAEDTNIRKIDVYIDPETEKVKRIYIEKIASAGDSTTLRKIVWTTGKQMQLTTIISKQGKDDRVIQHKYFWGMQ